MTSESGSPPHYNYETSSLTSSDLKSEFPDGGSYNFLETNSKTDATVSVTLNYAGRTHFAPPPTLTASSYDGLSGLNPDQAYTFSFNQFTPSGSRYLGIIFFTITDISTGAVVYSTSTESLTTTDFVVPADALSYGVNYEEEIDFSTRDEIRHPSCNSTLAHQCPRLGEEGWDSRTQVFFATEAAPPSLMARGLMRTEFAPSVPEVPTWLMLALGFAGLGLAGSWASRNNARSLAFRGHASAPLAWRAWAAARP